MPWARGGQILGQFLTESVALSGLGGLFGTLLGSVAVAGYATRQHWPVVLEPGLLAAGCAGVMPTEALAT